MVHSCCMVGCANRQNKEAGISLHRIPHFPEERKEAWVKIINRVVVDGGKQRLWRPNDNARVCSIHFLGGKPSDEVGHPDYLPNQNLKGKEHKRPVSENSVKRHERAKKRKATKQTTTPECSTSAAEDESAAATLLALSQGSPFKKNSESQTRPLKEANEIETLQAQLKTCQKRIDALTKTNKLLKGKLESSKLSYNSLPDDKFPFYTGISKALFSWVLDLVKPKITDVKKVTGFSLENHLLLVLTKIRLGLLMEDLGHRFQISQASVSRIWNTWVPLIANSLNPLIVWPERDVVRANIPSSFKPTYGKVMSIIDCFEIFIDRPHNLTARAQTWSNYKHNNTVKYLISITPSGAINFLSAGWGGRVSDKEITLQSGYMDKLLHGDEVLADRGFLVSEEMAALGVTLRMPSFTRGKKQLSSKDVEVSKNLAHVRIHVERVIGRMKNFLFLQSSVPVNQMHMLDDIIIIVGALHNLMPSIVKD